MSPFIGFRIPDANTFSCAEPDISVRIALTRGNVIIGNTRVERRIILQFLHRIPGVILKI